MPTKSPPPILSLRLPRIRVRPRIAPFPKGFFFGVATSDHQCEAYEPKWEDVRDRWEQLEGRTPRGRATEFWDRYPEDIALAAGLGCGAFRFSVAWARVEPEPGRFDEAVLDHYRRLLERIVAARMIPIVTLHHFTWPLHVEDRGGMIAAGFPHEFANYAERVARALGSEVGYWITFNEPTFLPLGYLKPWGMSTNPMPPGLDHASTDEQVRAAASLIRNLFLAHREARARIRALHPAAKVGTNPIVLGFPKALQEWLDHTTTRPRDPESWAKSERRGLEGYPDLVTGVVDVMFGAFTRTASRERHMLFSEGYAQVRAALLVAADDPARSAADLDGARVAAARGGNYKELLPHCGVRLEPVWVRSLEAAVERLRAGRVRAVMSDNHLLSRVMAVQPERWHMFVLDLPPQSYAAAVALNREPLLREVDAAIREVLTGDAGPDAPARVRRRVRADWLATDPIAGVRRRGQLVVGVRRGGSPFAWRDPATGEWRGLEIDVARTLARRVLGDPRRVHIREFDVGGRTLAVSGWWMRPLEFIHRLVALFSTVLNTDWWYLGMAGRLPAFLCPPECIGEMDFIGLDYYWGVPELRWDRIRALLDSIRGQFANAPVHPGGLRRLLSRYARTFPGLEIVVIENGCVESADGLSRAEYLRAHLWEVQKAVAAGLPVRGYLYWSLTSNREWGLPFEPHSDFGLYHVDLERDPELKRVPTPAAGAYRAIIRSRNAASGGRPRLRRWLRKVRAQVRRASRAR